MILWKAHRAIPGDSASRSRFSSPAVSEPVECWVHPHTHLPSRPKNFTGDSRRVTRQCHMWLGIGGLSTSLVLLAFPMGNLWVCSIALSENRETNDLITPVDIRPSTLDIAAFASDERGVGLRSSRGWRRSRRQGGSLPSRRRSVQRRSHLGFPSCEEW